MKQQYWNKGTETFKIKKSQWLKYGQSFSGKQQSQQQNFQRAHLNPSKLTQKFSVNRNKFPPPERNEQLLLLPVSYVKGSRFFDNSLISEASSPSGWIKLLDFMSFLRRSSINNSAVPQHWKWNETVSLCETVTVSPLTKSNINSALHQTIARHFSTYHPLTFWNSTKLATPSRNVVTYISLA